MTREIKFRAWDVEQGQMTYSPMDGYPEAVNLNERIKCFQKQALGKVLMQFTGLLDKNGKEIYEGDIIIDHDTKIKHIVSWNEKQLQWWLDRVNDDYGKGSYPAKGIRVEEQGLYEKGWEYVGNIYENPELIK